MKAALKLRVEVMALPIIFKSILTPTFNTTDMGDVVVSQATPPVIYIDAKAELYSTYIILMAVRN